MKLENMMEPPWKVFEMSQTSMGWRMGGGEGYLCKWTTWFQQLNQEEQQAYIAQYPEPEDWFHFYPQNSHQSKEESYARVEQTRTLRTTYCDLQYELAMLHEEAGHYQHAVMHLGNIIFCLRTCTIWDDAKTDKAIGHYVVLKRQLVQQMALNPVIRASWNALRQSDQRTRIAPRRTAVTIEDYARMQQEIYFPSELGRTWTKCFEDDTLYIHRHWNEPCLFLVILEPAGQGYRIAEAWRNNDPAISRPLTRPPTEPGLLLTRLLGRFIKE
jgi:hypothetical protein